MASSVPARVAYDGLDGHPRVIPIAFFWTGSQFVICTVPTAPKVAALLTRPELALTIDTNAWPPNVLLVRGTTNVEIVDGVPIDYLEASKKLVPEQSWPDFESQVKGLYRQMARIVITPTWAKLLDFETRLPSPIEELIRQRS